MTAELHKIIVRAALKLLAEKSDQEIEKMIGFPVARELIDWCVANPRWEDPEMTSLLNAVLEMSKQNTEMLKNL